MASIKANCRKIICIGRNYVDHIKELNNIPPSQPFFFLKPPTSILAPPHHQTPIVVPRGTTVHYEVELGLVIGQRPAPTNLSSSSSSTTSTSTFKPLHNLKFPTSSDSRATAQALTYIKSYVLAIDLTARNVQDEAKAKGLPWTIAKGFDTFCPISHPIGNPGVITDPHDVTLHLSVNGQTKQRDSTNLMIFRVPRILEDVSRVMSLEDGDLVLTGTPKGVGRVVAGDKIVCGMEVDGKEVEQAGIRIGVVDGPGLEEGGYVFRET